jgi:Zn-dependent protease
LLFWLLELLGERLGGPVPVIGVCRYLALINFVLASFNLVPAYPLDGGRLLRAALWAWCEDLKAATRIASQIGRAFSLGLIVLGALSFIAGNIIGGVGHPHRIRKLPCRAMRKSRNSATLFS